MRRRFAAAWITAILTVGSAHASSIGVFFSSDGTDCDGAIPPGSPFTFYILAILGGDAAAGGITGAEYRITGSDPGWFANYTPPPGTCDPACSSPLDGVGANVAWPSCQAPPSRVVLLGTVSGFNPSSSAERTMRVQARNPPTNPIFDCPLVTLCDAAFTRLCVLGGEAFVNRSVPCTVGVERSSWTQVKALYID